MRKITKLIVLTSLLVVFGSSRANAQLRSITEEPQAFIEELTEFLEDLDGADSDSVEAHMLAFTPVWTNIDENVRRSLYGVTNNMLRRRVRDYNYWRDYLQIIEHFYNVESLELSQEFWSYMEQYSSRANQLQIGMFYHQLKDIFGQRVVFRDGRVLWEVYNGDVEFFMEETPKVRYTNVDLWCYNGIDSSMIESTNGVLDIHNTKFKGDGGTVYWEKSGYSIDSLYADVFSYELDLNRTHYSIDTVRVHSLLYLSGTLMGSYENRLAGLENMVGKRYPIFVSYESLTIPDIVPNVDYRGGFSIVGEAFVASENLPKTAQLTFKYDGKPLFTFNSDVFTLTQKEISGLESAISVSMGESDSIYHPKISFGYNTETGLLNVIRSSEGLGMTPFRDTYHNLDITAEQITWQMNSPQFYFEKLATSSDINMVFESSEYFRKERFEALSGGIGSNPLYELRRVALARDTLPLSLDVASSMLNMNSASAERFLLLMSIQGFVGYNRFTQQVTFNDKLFDYVQNAEGRRDFDVIRFVSNVETGVNAEVSLLNYDMTIAGIRAIALSDSQEVALFPAGRMITVHEGLDFDFDGVVRAGRFTYFAQNNFFDYDMFRISMPDIDSMKFKVEEFGSVNRIPGQRPRLVDVKNTLQDINGELLIDRPNNKSGKLPYHGYPIFKSGTGSFVYYDNPNIYGGVYDRDEFYVELEPFEIDSLDNTSTAGLKFSGVFVSAGVFPDMQQDIRVQEDYSLGFATNTGPGGLQAYGGAGTFTNDLSLSNEGLVGSGTIEYLTATAQGDEFLFFPDSTYGVANTFMAEARISGPVNTPRAQNTNVVLDWRPYDDVMYATSQSTPFDMYDIVDMKAEGTIAYEASDMRGDARLSFLDAETVSKDYQFYNTSFEARSLNFKVRADASSDWAFRMQDADGLVDFTTMKGDFTLNGGVEYMEFTTNQYITWMDHADWDIPAKTIAVNHASGELSRMVSVNPVQDSLDFEGMSAKFSLLPSLLEIYEVPHIDVADARVFPDSGYVAVREEADMRRLQNSRLIANRYTEYHQFSEGDIKVKGADDYGGSATYDYVDADGVIWPLFFERIEADQGTTIGQTKVEREDGFYLSSFFGYYGEVELNAPDPHLSYNGYVLIQHTCENLETDWFRFESKIDPYDIVIDLPEDNPRINSDNIYNGIYLAPDSSSIYTGFLNKDASRADQELISATGVLYYDMDLSSYIIAPKESLEDESFAGNYVAFNNRTCVMTGKGKITLVADPGRVKLDTYGVIEHDLRNDQLTMDVVMAMDFYFASDVIDAIAADVGGGTGGSAVNLNREAYEIAMNFMFEDDEDRQEYFEDVVNYGAPDDLPRDLRNTFLISQMELEWDEEARSFLADGTVGIGSIGEVQINRKVEGIFEITRRRRRNELYFFLEPSRDYYYFQYIRNNMQFYSTDRELLNLLLQVESEDRVLDATDDEPRYMFGQSSRGRASIFLRRHGRAE